MNIPRRMYRVFPTVLAVVAFLLLGSLAVRQFQSSPRVMAPQEEVQAVYYALAWGENPPPALTVSDVRFMLARMDPGMADIADRITVVSYAAGKQGFELQLRHAGLPDKTWAVTPNGIR